MGRISALTELTSLASNDYIIVLDSSANIAKKITVANAFGLTDYGWTASGETWTYSSFTSSTKIAVVTVPTDATTKYAVGMKVKVTQTTGGTKYGRITAVTATTLSIYMLGTSTVLNNEAITAPQYSIGDSPYAPSTINWEEQQLWQTPTLLNGWANYGGGFGNAAYMKSFDGFVYLKGMVRSGTGNIFVLPAGYRPGAVGYYAVSNNTAGSAGIVSVDSSGTVKIDSGLNGYLSFDTVRFRAEN